MRGKPDCGHDEESSVAISRLERVDVEAHELVQALSSPHELGLKFERYIPVYLSRVRLLKHLGRKGGPLRYLSTRKLLISHTEKTEGKRFALDTEDH